MCIHLGMPIKAEENDKVVIITDMEGPPRKAMAQARTVVKQHLVRFCPNAFIGQSRAAKWYFPLCILLCCHTLGAGTSFLEAFRLPGICYLATAIHPFKCSYIQCTSAILDSWCSFSTAQCETSRAGCAEVRSALCTEQVFKRFPRKISKCNQQTFFLQCVWPYNRQWLMAS